jgi:hypothetical protein
MNSEVRKQFNFLQYDLACVLHRNTDLSKNGDSVFHSGLYR